MTVRVDDIVGAWLLVHDDFEGLLNIRPPDQRRVAEDPPCSYESWTIDGDYQMWGAPPVRSVHGTFQGQDPYWQVAAQCPESRHLVRFTIDFPGEPPQPFEATCSRTCANGWPASPGGGDCPSAGSPSSRA
jgi:hypothetical protein